MPTIKMLVILTLLKSQTDRSRFLQEKTATDKWRKTHGWGHQLQWKLKNKWSSEKEKEKTYLPFSLWPWQGKHNHNNKNYNLVSTWIRDSCNFGSDQDLNHHWWIDRQNNNEIPSNNCLLLCSRKAETNRAIVFSVNCFWCNSVMALRI